MKLEIKGTSAVSTYTDQDLKREAQRVAKKNLSKLAGYALELHEKTGQLRLAVRIQAKSGDVATVRVSL